MKIAGIVALTLASAIACLPERALSAGDPRCGLSAEEIYR